MLRRALIGLFAVALVASLAFNAVLYLRYDLVDAELASARAAAADETSQRRDAQTALADAEEALEASRKAQADLEDELEQELSASEEKIADLQAQVADLEHETDEASQRPAAADDTSGQSDESASEDSSTESDPEPSPAPAASGEDPCDVLGGFHELGSQGCADLLAEMEACEQQLANDPDWVPFDGALWENTVTGDVTTCDI